jgi:hypothetical protein
VSLQYQEKKQGMVSLVPPVVLTNHDEKICDIRSLLFEWKSVVCRSRNTHAIDPAATKVRPGGGSITIHMRLDDRRGYLKFTKLQGKPSQCTGIIHTVRQKVGGRIVTSPKKIIALT